MKFEPLIQFIKQVQGRLHSSVYTPLQQQRNPQHIAFLRQLKKELKAQESLTVPLNKLDAVVFDMETTGFFPEKGDEIISIGAVRVKGDQILDDSFYSLIRYNEPLSSEIKHLTGITNESLKQAPDRSEVLIQFYDFVKGDTLVAHHANHEKNFLHHANWKLFKSQFKHRIIDTALLFRLAEPDHDSFRLEDCCNHCGIPTDHRHHALGDARMTAQLWCSYFDKLRALGCHTLFDVYEKLAVRRGL